MASSLTDGEEHLSQGALFRILNSMRRSTLTAEELQTAERAAEDRRQGRTNGYSLMEIRDRGYADVRSVAGDDMMVRWHRQRNPELREGEVRTVNVPEGMVWLEIGDEYGLFRVDDLQKWLRWA